jgi:uncharacterized protein YbjT (DUF2867 family)
MMLSEWRSRARMALAAWRWRVAAWIVGKSRPPANVLLAGKQIVNLANTPGEFVLLSRDEIAAILHACKETAKQHNQYRD